MELIAHRGNDTCSDLDGMVGCGEGEETPEMPGYELSDTY